jgi:transposase-like protein
VARQYDVATSLIYKWRHKALSAKSGGTSFAPAVVVNERAGSSDKAVWRNVVAISVVLPDGTRVSSRPAALLLALAVLGLHTI